MTAQKSPQDGKCFPTVTCKRIKVLNVLETFTRRFYPKRLTNEEKGSNQNQQKSNDMQVL